MHFHESERKQLYLTGLIVGITAGTPMNSRLYGAGQNFINKLCMDYILIFIYIFTKPVIHFFKGLCLFESSVS